MQSIYFVFSSLGMQRRLIQTNVCNELLLFCQKGSHLQTFTSSSLKMLFFPRVRCWNKFLRLMFFSSYNNHKVLFFIWVYRYSAFLFNHHDIPFFETSVLHYFISWMHVCLFKLDFWKKNLSLSGRMFLYLWEQTPSHCECTFFFIN